MKVAGITLRSPLVPLQESLDRFNLEGLKRLVDAIEKPEAMASAASEIAAIAVVNADRERKIHALSDLLGIGGPRMLNADQEKVRKDEIAELRNRVAADNARADELRKIVAAVRPEYAAEIRAALAPSRQDAAATIVRALDDIMAATRALQYSHSELRRVGIEVSAMAALPYAEPFRAMAQKIAMEFASQSHSGQEAA